MQATLPRATQLTRPHKQFVMPEPDVHYLNSARKNYTKYVKMGLSYRHVFALLQAKTTKQPIHKSLEHSEVHQQFTMLGNIRVRLHNGQFDNQNQTENHTHYVTGHDQFFQAPFLFSGEAIL